MIRNFHVDKAIMSCKGLDASGSITDSSEYHSSTKQAMMASANQTILALDYSKFDKISFVKIADLSSISMVVTNRMPSRQWLQQFEQWNLPCLYPAPDGNTEQ